MFFRDFVKIMYLDVQAPAFHKPTDEEFFDPQDRTKPNIAFLKNHFCREGRLTDEQALFIIKSGTDLLRREPNVLEVDAPITGFFFRAIQFLTEQYVAMSMDNISI